MLFSAEDGGISALQANGNSQTIISFAKTLYMTDCGYL